jgi:hypothetical protein
VRNNTPTDDAYCVATADLAEIIEPIIQQLEEPYDLNDHGWSKHDKSGGPYVAIYKATADLLEQTETSVMRRLWSIRNKTSLSTSLDIADAILMALDRYVTTENIPIFPTCKQTAIAQVRTNFPELNEEETQTLARSLLNLSKGYLEGSADEETRRYIAEHTAKATARKQRNRAAKREAANAPVAA